MYCNFRSIKQHADDSKRVMETGDHFKNGASPKSQMSRINRISERRTTLNYVLLCLLGLVLFSCSESGMLIPVELNGKWGYIDRKGTYVINPQFKGASPFSEGLALVETQDGKLGYIDEEGKYVIKAIYEEATKFAEGLAFTVTEGGYPICIDKTGKTKFELKDAQLARIFSEGLAAVCVKDKWGYVDKNGKMAITPQFEGVSLFSENLAIIRQNDKLGFIDKSGKYVINPQFELAGLFYEGYAAVSDGQKFGFIDKSGKYVIAPQFDDVLYFSEGLAAVKQGRVWGFIDKKGKYIINPQFEETTGFKNGRAVIATDDDKYGVINKKGVYIINPQFESASLFIDFIAVSNGEKIGFVDDQGKYIINPQFDDYCPISYLEKITIVESDYTENVQVTAEKLITSTTIAGVPFIGMKISEVQKYFSNDMKWEHIEGDEETDSPEEYIIKRGNNILLRLYMEENKRVYAMYIYDTNLKTKEGIHVGSTAGDLLKAFPNAMVRNAEFGEYTSINDIIYVFDSDYENYVGTYNDNDVSKIVNRNIKIGYIIIGDI